MKRPHVREVKAHLGELHVGDVHVRDLDIHRPLSPLPSI